MLLRRFGQFLDLLAPSVSLRLHFLELLLDPPRPFQLVFLSLCPPLLNLLLDASFVLFLLVFDVLLVLPLVLDVQLLVLEVEVDQVLPQHLALILKFKIFVAVLAEFRLLLLDLAQAVLNLQDLALNRVKLLGKRGSLFRLGLLLPEVGLLLGLMRLEARFLGLLLLGPPVRRAELLLLLFTHNFIDRNKIKFINTRLPWTLISN